MAAPRWGGTRSRKRQHPRSSGCLGLPGVGGGPSPAVQVAGEVEAGTHGESPLRPARQGERPLVIQSVFKRHPGWRLGGPRGGPRGSEDPGPPRMDSTETANLDSRESRAILRGRGVNSCGDSRESRMSGCRSWPGGPKQGAASEPPPAGEVAEDLAAQPGGGGAHADSRESVGRAAFGGSAREASDNLRFVRCVR